ncbi:CvfB family protein [Kineothrix sp. MB12-C1]|uniref:CvfB family protein n=1 Tax=Kineothrix sp. MB12-C1 TaxID=3070215 RepID=UPI0027D34BDD|nr:S1-like domain-containing RNA-binding protein [Kineothrix sp. MB12-C1]WMC91585.1 S1-like domain-containing RNA-binding protein [Kineothrix sp. MB12-C1]
MIKLGEIQNLEVVKKVDFGVYLATEGENAEERVLLPEKQVPEGTEIGDTVRVFIYRDSNDRLIATTREAALTLGEVALLKVAQVARIGAFLDWGLEKQLLLPFKEQTWQVREGEECLAALYIDKSNRLCATMKVYHYLDTNSPYKKDDRVTGRVYEISREFGAFVAVDDKYSGLISVKEMYGPVREGDIVTARVASVKEDGKLDLSIREKAYIQIGTDADQIMEVIESRGGELPFNDKADPETIKREMDMSKNEFKRAVGRLLKEGKITIGDSYIKKCDV